MIHPLAPITLAQLLAHQPRHHGLDPLFADDGVLGLFQAGGVVVVDVVEGGRDGGFAGEERGGFGGGHFLVVGGDGGRGDEGARMVGDGGTGGEVVEGEVELGGLGQGCWIGFREAPRGYFWRARSILQKNTTSFSMACRVWFLIKTTLCSVHRTTQLIRLGYKLMQKLRAALWS